MNRSKLQLSDLNPHLMCVLCGGYYIDATTIVECLHSFCRSCIVKHLESSKYCPICEVQVHKTKPLINIRPDKTLQDIVYKLVPGLFASEMRNRRKFYRERPHYMKPNDSESVGEVPDDAKVYVNDENITFSLDYHTSTKQQGCMENSFHEISMPIKSEKRYFKCPTGVTIYHLQKLLKAKYDLNDNNYKVEIFYKDQPLHEDFTLLDIAYIYLWKNKGNFDLTFKIYESAVKRQKIEESVKKEPLTEEKKQPDVRLEPLTAVKAEVTEPTPAKPMEGVVEAAAAEPVKDVESETSKVGSPTASVKQNGVLPASAPAPKEVQLQISESGVMSVSQVENGEVVRTVEERTATKDGFNHKTNASVSGTKSTTTTTTTSGKIGMTTAAATATTTTTAVTATSMSSTTVQMKPQPTRSSASEQPPKQTQSKPTKSYRTIQCPPNAWNPVIPKEKLRPTLMKNSDEPKKPLKFFKMRNMPRFLGNPASGVKPMYAESSAMESDDRRGHSEERRDNTKALKNILKIDPKTLRPIEKEEMSVISAPSTPNLLTNPFIPNNNHFLFSDPLLLHPNAGNYSNLGKSDKHNNNNTTSTNHNTNNNNVSSSNNNYSNNSSSSGSNNSNNNSNGKPSGSSRPPIQNGTFPPPMCFPTPDFCSNFFPYQSNFTKHPGFYPPTSDKIDPLIRASRLSPFANIPAFNVAGFHASLPPSISLLLKHQTPHHQHKKATTTTTTSTGNQFTEKKTIATSTATTTTTTTAAGITTTVPISTAGATTAMTTATTVSPAASAVVTTTTTTRTTVPATVCSEKDESTKKEKNNRNCDDNSLKMPFTNGKRKGEEEAKVQAVTATATVKVGSKEDKSKEGQQQKQQQKVEEKKKKDEVEEMEKDKENVAKKAGTESQETGKKEEGKGNQDTGGTAPITRGTAAAAEEGDSDGKKGKGDEVTAKPEMERSTCQDETSACNAEAKPDTVDNNNDNKSVNDKAR